MKVTRDVIRDLLPVYLSGEATADTIALVDEFLRDEPEMAASVREAKRLDLPPLRQVRAGAAVERRALLRTRRHIQGRGTLLFFALLFTFAPFSFVFTDAGVQWSMWRDAPAIAHACIALAVLFWAMFVLLKLKLRSTGL
jgi:hypothetical protein